MSTAAATFVEPHVRIRATSGWRALDLRQVWVFRDLLTTLAERDIKLRYRQTALGVIWVVLQPLLAAGIFSFVFGRVANLPSDGVPYFIFSFTGLLAWNAFNSTITKISACLVGNSQLISKVYFPRLILPLSTVFSTLIDFGVAALLLGLLMFLHGIVPTAAILLTPIWLALILMLAIGLGLIAAALMVTYRDVQHIMPVMIQFLLYASPVAYASSAVPEHLRVFFFCNPMASLLDAFRWSILGTGQIHAGALAASACMTVLIFIGGAFCFRKMERMFADLI